MPTVTMLRESIGTCSRCQERDARVRHYGRKRFCIVCEPANRRLTPYSMLPECARTFDRLESAS